MTSEEILAYVEKVRKESEEKNLPVMRRRTAALLAEIVSAEKPTQALEIGTCAGVSALTALAAGVEHLTTVEKDEERFLSSRLAFSVCEVSSRVTQIKGDCNEVLGYLNGNVYDFIILDGPKSSLLFQYEESMRMLRVGGMIFIDDVDYHGMIKGEGAKHKQRTIITAMRAFLEKIKSDERIEVTFYEIEDGVAVIRKMRE